MRGGNIGEGSRMLHLCISDALFNLVWTQVTVVALGLALEPGPALKLARQSLGLDSQTYPGYGHRKDCNRAPSHGLSQCTSRPNVSGPRPCEDVGMSREARGPTQISAVAPQVSKRLLLSMWTTACGLAFAGAAVGIVALSKIPSPADSARRGFVDWALFLSLLGFGLALPSVLLSGWMLMERIKFGGLAALVAVTFSSPGALALAISLMPYGKG